MRCMACGAEMLLMNSVQDDTMAVSGFQHQTFMCSSCHDVERRLVFAKQDEPIDVAAPTNATPEDTAAEGTSVAPASAREPEYTAPSISPVATLPSSPVAALPSVAADQIERAPARGVLRRVFARLRGG